MFDKEKTNILIIKKEMILLMTIPKDEKIPAILGSGSQNSNSQKKSNSF